MHGGWNANKTKILLAVLLLIGAGSLLFAFRRASPLPDKITFVCVETGATFNIDRDKVYVIPARNPRTGQATLLPCSERNGVLYVGNHYRGALLNLGEKNHYVDTQTLAVRKK